MALSARSWPSICALRTTSDPSPPPPGTAASRFSATASAKAPSTRRVTGRPDCAASAAPASWLRPAQGMFPGPPSAAEPVTGPSPGSWQAIRKAAAPAARAASYLRRLCTCLAPSMNSCRTSTTAPRTASPAAAISAGVPRPRSSSGAVSDATAGERPSAWAGNSLPAASTTLDEPRVQPRYGNRSRPAASPVASARRDANHSRARASLPVPAKRPPKSLSAWKSASSSPSARTRASTSSSIAPPPFPRSRSGLGPAGARCNRARWRTRWREAGLSDPLVGRRDRAPLRVKCGAELGPRPTSPGSGRCRPRRCGRPGSPARWSGASRRAPG